MIYAYDIRFGDGHYQTFRTGNPSPLLSTMLIGAGMDPDVTYLVSHRLVGKTWYSTIHSDTRAEIDVRNVEFFDVVDRIT